MKIKNALKMIATVAVTTGASTAFSHDGHGMTDTHWHATDVWGFVTVGGMIALAIWLSRNGK